MRFSVMVFGLVCVCALVIGTAAPVIQDEDVRGAFLTSRPKDKPATSGNTARPSRRRPKTTSGSTNAGSNNPGASNSKPGKPAVKTPEKSETSGKTTTPSKPATPVNAPRIGLGVTLFMRDSNGSAVRVDPNHVFQKGDRVRVLLETNTDGYLYIFNSTNDGAATMIYPHADLDEAGNYLQAHVPFEIPSSLSTDERLRWFAFDEVAGAERLFFVFTREPLSGVPIEDDLIALCRESKERCPVRPSSEVWAVVQKEMQEPLKTDKTQQFGGAQTATEQQATARGLGLSKDDPPPSLVMMASSPRSTLVATLDLIHK
ncbi:MAG TPA: DUF4384 domain-containing protein [Pyrinomonadaceae bacterium]|nr:DUF4384 domain-containing protein [Pyrinomonadaceae bacterium]